VDLQLAALRRDRETVAAEQRPAEPVVLPFLRPYGEGAAQGVVRHAAHAPAGPHLVRLQKARRDGRRAR
jgi:hypothetical protein